MKINKFFSIFVALIATSLCYSSCDKDDSDDEPKKNNERRLDDETNNGSDNGNNNGSDNGNNNGNNSSSNNQPTQTIPDFFVYYQDAQFLYIRTNYNNEKEKILWVVTDYDQSTSTASITSTICTTSGYEQKTFYLRQEANGALSYSSSGSSWSNLTDYTQEFEFMNIGKAHKPSGLLGNVVNKIKYDYIAGPNGTNAPGCIAKSEYDNSKNDSYMYDDVSYEYWNAECGLVKSYVHTSNAKEYPIYTYSCTYELVSYYIPMPDGTIRQYEPASSSMMPVTDLEASCYYYNSSSNRYNSISFKWYDENNQDVLKYNLYNMYQDEVGNWYYQQVFSDNNFKLDAWFVGNKSTVNGKNVGYYSSDFKSGKYFVNYFTDTYFYFFVTAESLYSETSFEDIDEVIGISVNSTNISRSTTYTLTHNKSLMMDLPRGTKLPGESYPIKIPFGLNLK